MGVGLEVEVEHYARTDAPDGWLAKKDDSLRNNGLEYITKFGCRVRDLFEHVSSLFNMFAYDRANAGGNYWEFSERTSIHVHLDARNFTTQDIKNVVLLYTIFEDSLFKFAGENRKHNVFCVPLRYIATSAVNLDNFQYFVKGWRKYCAMNLLRLHDMGTIEFRHMEGNDDYNRVIKWVLILGSMMQYAKTIPTDKLMEEIKVLKRLSQYQQFAQQVFGVLAPELQIDPMEYDIAVSDAKQLFNLRTE